MSHEEKIRRFEARRARNELPMTRFRFFLELPTAATFFWAGWKVNEDIKAELKKPDPDGSMHKFVEPETSPVKLWRDAFFVAGSLTVGSWLFTRQELRETIGKAFHNVVSGDVFKRKQQERSDRDPGQDQV